jgi:ABC-type Fe3+/spermidine/putrescine transport system ATPase subunit
VHVRPHQRGIGLVFQDARLFPHLWHGVTFNGDVAALHQSRFKSLIYQIAILGNCIQGSVEQIFLHAPIHIVAIQAHQAGMDRHVLIMATSAWSPRRSPEVVGILGHESPVCFHNEWQQVPVLGIQLALPTPHANFAGNRDREQYGRAWD